MRYLLFRNLLHGIPRHPVRSRLGALIKYSILTNSIIRSHETDKKAQNKNRDESGCNLHPFQDANLAKYGVTRKNPQATIADEYPLASSIEGGVSVHAYGRAIIQGATSGDQQGTIPFSSFSSYAPCRRASLTDTVLGQSNWSRKLWQDPQIPQGAKIHIVLTNWDPKLR